MDANTQANAMHATAAAPSAATAAPATTRASTTVPSAGDTTATRTAAAPRERSRTPSPDGTRPFNTDNDDAGDAASAAHKRGKKHASTSAMASGRDDMTTTHTASASAAPSAVPAATPAAAVAVPAAASQPLPANTDTGASSAAASGTLGTASYAAVASGTTPSAKTGDGASRAASPAPAVTTEFNTLSLTLRTVSWTPALEIQALKVLCRRVTLQANTELRINSTGRVLEVHINLTVQQLQQANVASPITTDAGAATVAIVGINTSAKSNDGIKIRIRNMPNDYTKDELKKAVEAFYGGKKVRAIYVDQVRDAGLPNVISRLSVTAIIDPSSEIKQGVMDLGKGRTATVVDDRVFTQAEYIAAKKQFGDEWRLLATQAEKLIAALPTQLTVDTNAQVYQQAQDIVKSVDAFTARKQDLGDRSKMMIAKIGRAAVQAVRQPLSTFAYQTRKTTLAGKQSAKTTATHTVPMLVEDDDLRRKVPVAVAVATAAAVAVAAAAAVAATATAAPTGTPVDNGAPFVTILSRKATKASNATKAARRTTVRVINTPDLQAKTATDDDQSGPESGPESGSDDVCGMESDWDDTAELMSTTVPAAVANTN